MELIAVLEFHDLGDAFSKERTVSLPPYDCFIDLLPGAPLASSRLYNKPEREAIERYINELLASGLVRSSSPPVGAGFFFDKKKDGTLKPCIDDQILNEIIIRNKYPLLLLYAAFTPLHQARIFNTSIYHLVTISDECKTAFNTPLGHFEFMAMPF